MLKKKGLSYNFKSKIVKTYIDFINLSTRISFKKAFIASYMLNMAYLTPKHIHLNFGPKNRAVKLHYNLEQYRYNQCFEERASHVRFEPTQWSTNLILYRLTI